MSKQRKRRLFPRVRYVNYRRQFPQAAAHVFDAWFSITRRWSGKLVYVSVKHHTLVLDYRVNWIEDLKRGN